MIDTLIFDLGNVIVDFIPLSIYEKATGSTSDGQLLYDLFMSSGIWHELDRGIPLEQVITLTSQKAPQHLHEAIAYVVHNWHDDLVLNTEMASYIKQLQVDFNVYLLSNVSKQFHDFRDRFSILDSFDGLYISADTKLLKPNIEIYQDFLTTFSLQPQQCFFIDDKEENILGARQIGIKGHVFDQDIEALKKAIYEISS